VALDEGLEPEDVGAAGEAHDALTAVREVLDQLQRTAAHGEHVTPRVACVVEGGPWLQDELIDGVVDALEIPLFQAGEQDGARSEQLRQSASPDQASRSVTFFTIGLDPILCDDHRAERPAPQCNPFIEPDDRTPIPKPS
jgi:hypothetical protein